MTPEAIVRALAAANPLCEHDFGSDCSLCGAPLIAIEVAAHEPDCPWRQACEWVAAHPPIPPHSADDFFETLGYGVPRQSEHGTGGGER